MQNLWHGGAANGGAMQHLPDYLADLRVEADPGRWQRYPIGYQGVEGMGYPLCHGLHDLLRHGQRAWLGAAVGL